MHSALQQLSKTLVDYLQPDQTLELKEAGITLYRCDSPIERISYVQQPSICMILYGEKDVYWGGRHFRYGSGQFCCYSVDLPVIGEVKHASPAKPYTGIQVALSAPILSQLIWPDGVSFSPDGWMYVSAAQISEVALFNQGKALQKPPYYIFRFKPLAPAKLGN